MSRFEIKIALALLLIAVIPLVASIVLVGQVIRVSDSVAEGQTRRLVPPLTRSAEAYRALFEALKRSFRLQAQLLAEDGALRAALERRDRAALERRAAVLVEREQGLGRLAVIGAEGTPLVTARRALPSKSAAVRELRLVRPLGEGARLELSFQAPAWAFADFEALGRAERTAREITSLRSDLASFYRVSFLIMFGAVLLVATGLGLYIARRMARRVSVLASATQRVASGDLTTEVQLGTRDELGELAEAFNEMVRQLRENRERITYLEKIGAWQEVARRLAHEIKNPLTPIQLAVQQIHQKYEGDDPKFRRLLDDAQEIVTEEVDGLRRLVQAFSSFAKLPSVQPEAVDVNALLDDFFKSHPELEQRATLRWTPLDPSCRVRVDRLLIKHVIFNLVENAVQAAEGAGRSDRVLVTISASTNRQVGRVTITVADDGPGMKQEILERIFDPYFTTKDHGSGLGLAIVKRTVLEHGGSISAWSKPGEGARFSVTLPLEPEPDEAKEGAGGRPRRSSSTHKTV
ncbi:MAG: HAMP domain-containing protein [Deltaproteobacteria bacterium]|nr:HAMP domain-containing protein [Deltaproteobacteria bacterium]